MLLASDIVKTIDGCMRRRVTIGGSGSVGDLLPVYDGQQVVNRSANLIHSLVQEELKHRRNRLKNLSKQSALENQMREVASRNSG